MMLHKFDGASLTGERGEWDEMLLTPRVTSFTVHISSISSSGLSNLALVQQLEVGYHTFSPWTVHRYPLHSLWGGIPSTHSPDSGSAPPSQGLGSYKLPLPKNMRRIGERCAKEKVNKTNSPLISFFLWWGLSIYDPTAWTEYLHHWYCRPWMSRAQSPLRRGDSSSCPSRRYNCVESSRKWRMRRRDMWQQGFYWRGVWLWMFKLLNI